MSTTRTPKSTKAKAKVSTAKAAKRTRATSVAESNSPPTTDRATTAAKPVSGLDAAAQVLREAAVALTTQDLVKRMLDGGLWTTKGKTPAATLYSAMIREISAKGSASRFRKGGPGLFAAAT